MRRLAALWRREFAKPKLLHPPLVYDTISITLNSRLVMDQIFASCEDAYFDISLRAILWMRRAASRRAGNRTALPQDLLTTCEKDSRE